MFICIYYFLENEIEYMFQSHHITFHIISYHITACTLAIILFPFTVFHNKVFVSAARMLRAPTPPTLSPRGFDASRGLGDVCTALCLPTQRLSDEGSMAVETALFSGESLTDEDGMMC